MRVRLWVALNLCLLAGLLGAHPARAGVVVAVRPTVVSAGSSHSAVVTVTGPDVPLNDLHLVATVGRIRDLSRISPGVFSARFDPPAVRTPDVALIVATAGAEAGCAAIPVLGRYHLRIRVEPHAHVSVNVVGDVTERQASRRGRLEMWLDVPPGAEIAEVTAEDRVGNRTVTREEMSPPASHRLALVDAGVMDSRHRRVWVLAGTPEGALASGPPRVEVADGEVTLEQTAPGVFLAAVTLPRRQTGMTARVRAEAQGAATAEIAIVSPPAVIATVGITMPSRVHAGEHVTARLTAHDADGVEIGGVASTLSLRATRGTLGEVLQQPDESYTVAWTAPGRAGDAVIEARGANTEGPAASTPPLHQARAVAVVSVVAGLPARWVVRQSNLQVALPGVVTLVALDRYGNPTDPVVGAVDVVGGAWLGQRPVGDGLRVSLTPQQTELRLVVHGTDGGSMTLGVHASAATPPIEGSIVARLGNNLHGFSTGGVRLRAHWMFPYGPWRLLVGAGTGYEGGQTSDAAGHGASINALPLEARVGGAFVTARVRFRAWAWAGGWWVQRAATDANGSSDSEGSLVGAGGLALGADYRIGSSAIGVETGYDLVHLDSGPVTGNPAGVYGALAWSYGAW